MSDQIPVTIIDFDALTTHETVVIFTGIRNDGEDAFVQFGVDNGPAQDIIAAMQGDDDVDVMVEPWQVLRVHQ